MAQLSRLAKLFVKISDNLTEEDVRSLKALLSIEEVLGRAKIEKATPLEIFDMLVENKTIAKGNLGFLVQVLKSLRKGKLAEKAERLEQEQRMEALQLAQQTGDLQEKMQIYFKKGDMQREQLHSPRTAIQYYEQHLALARQLGDRRQEGWAYNRLGMAYSDMGEYETALKYHRQYLKIVLESGDQKEQTKAHTNVGESYRLLGKLNQATSHFNTALQLVQQTRDLQEEMEIYFKKGDMQRVQLHSPRTAIQYYEQHLALARQLGDRREEGLAYNRLGHAYSDMGEYETALKYNRQHLKIIQESGDKKEQRQAHTNVGDSYRSLGKTDQATSHFHTALQLAQQTGDLHGQMDVYFNMGDMQREQLHSPRTAIQYYEQYLALARQLGDRREEGWAYSRLGQAHSDMGKHQEALEWFQKSLKKLDGDKKEQIRLHACVGNEYRNLGKLDQATSHLDTALQLAQQTGDLHLEMNVYCKMGDLQREQLHSPRTAIQYYEQHLALARQLGNRHEEGVAYNRLGLAQYKMGKYKAAVEWHQKDLQINQESGHNIAQILAHKNMADSYKAMDKLDQVRSHYQSALTIATETGNKQEQMDIYLSLGDLHREQLHEPQESHKYYTEMLALAKDLERKGKEGQAYNRLGLACDDMQDNEAALEWYQKSLMMDQEDENKTDQLAAHKNIARSYQALGKLDKARSHYQSALAIAKETGNKQAQKDINLGLGDLHRKQLHEPQESHKYYTEMLELAKDLGRKDKEGLAYNRLGLVCEGMQDNEAALEWHQKHLKMSEEDENKTEQLTAHRCIARSYQELGKLEQARSHYQLALIIAKETGNKQAQKDIKKKMEAFKSCSIM
ncbi:PREDICTED: tetratricopeptide repeat protein 28-like [Branchiostoma belcheri]|uniref:Tetratricopeptide repeat protein 28-like n=1 Tax=Branchiostoma belcheri TaxID=7741 RepID=A0A6P4YAZ3_BRABE|nr:PREDICTED: tetratricopeptide repeat protein 28-like [Branchiostoma belcheri]